ncbi:hypothetical protein KA057_03470 [Candidatus Gracilibacteria bacterium]|nr:hypothetical protein [Candidatus Gracilibacteria bacterium]
MKRILFILFSYLSLQSVVQAFTGNIGNPKYTFDVDSIFPSPQKVPGDNGVDNVIDYIVAMIPLLTTLMAVGAVIMVIFGGFQMVIGGANSEQTEKGKSIIKDALMGLLFGLLAYVIITTLGNILDI